MAGTKPGVAPTPFESMDELVEGTLVGEYQIKRKIGEGGMGVVYSAVHPIIGKRAAVKVISRSMSDRRESIQRFVQEAQAVNQIAHPNIVDIFSFGTLPDGRSYFVMELLRGENVAERLHRGPIKLVESLEILLGVCGALEATHRQGIVHRDLKPENVFLDDRGDRRTLKLLDFGIAKLQRSDGAQITLDGTAMGTPTYASPELARGQAVDARGDIYSLGVMAYEMIVGTAPFHSEVAIDLFIMHVSRPPPAPHTLWVDIPPVLDELLLRMLAKDPANRPPLDEIRNVFAAAMVDAGAASAPLRELNTVRAQVIAPASFPSTEEVSALHPMKKPRWALVGAAIVLSGGLGFAFVAHSTNAPPHTPIVVATPVQAPIPAPIPAPVLAPAPAAIPERAPPPSPTPAPVTAPTPTHPAHNSSPVTRTRPAPPHPHEDEPARVKPTHPAPRIDDDDSAINPYAK